MTADPKAEKPDASPGCDNCMYWEYEGRRGSVRAGECRRRATVISLGMNTPALKDYTQEKDDAGNVLDFEDSQREQSRMRLFPETLEYDWCGDYRRGYYLNRWLVPDGQPR